MFWHRYKKVWINTFNPEKRQVSGDYVVSNVFIFFLILRIYRGIINRENRLLDNEN